MHAEIQTLRKRINGMRWYIFMNSAVMIALVMYAFKTPVQKFDIIRARGIVIEDSTGRDRILIGAPIPFSKHRVRNDTNLVRKYWSGGYDDSNQYMRWYQDYYHGAEGMVVMNEKGFDRVLVGDKLADPNSGKRMFEIAGIAWNDREGWELGGAGVNTSKSGRSRSVIGVDDKDGEAVHLVALEDGTKGLIVGGENGRLMIGMSKKNGQWFGNKDAFTGVKFFDTEGKLVWEQQMNK